MNQRIIDGILVTRPTRDDVLNLQVRDLAPDCFGAMKPVTEIFGRGVNVHGKVFVCYCVEFGEPGTTSTISEGMTEEEPVATLPAVSRWHRSENFPRWED